jgi:hypothetical protein
VDVDVDVGVGVDCGCGCDPFLPFLHILAVPKSIILAIRPEGSIETNMTLAPNFRVSNILVRSVCYLLNRCVLLLALFLPFCELKQIQQGGQYNRGEGEGEYS